MNSFRNVYEQQEVSNRLIEKKAFAFQSLPSYQAEAILEKMAEDAKRVQGLEKEAAVLSNPFEAFGHAQTYIASKFGLQRELAHDLASSVVGKAKGLRAEHGGELSDMITGIVDHMNPDEVRNKVGAEPIRTHSPGELKEHVKMRLVEEMSMSSYQADQFKEIVLTHARNLITIFRPHSLLDITNAILDIVVNYQDSSLIYSFTSSASLKDEVRHRLSGE